jgi:hypothetical protein
MGKELQRKVIEAGIIPPQSVKLLKMWQSLPDDLPTEEREHKTQQQLLELVDQIGELLDVQGEIPELKETEFELEMIWQRSARTVKLVYRMGAQHLDCRLPAARTRQGAFSFRHQTDVELILRPGTQITTREQEVFEITQVEVRYVEDAANYLVCSVQEVPDHAVVRSVPEVSSRR